MKDQDVAELRGPQAIDRGAEEKKSTADTETLAGPLALGSTAAADDIDAALDVTAEATADAGGALDATAKASEENATPIGAEKTLAASPPASNDLTRLVTVDRDFYEFGAEIARGGMGRILRARDLRLGRTIAIKELLSPSSALERRFEREMKITAGLQHPAIISVHEAGRWPNGVAFYSMKLVDGRPLDEVINATQTLHQRLALLPNVIAVADSIAYAHERQIIHRDLKPANVLIGDFGETVVIDWGLAKHLKHDAHEDLLDDEALPSGDDDDDDLTIQGRAMGTPAYMPPAQAEGRVLDAKADVYALGAMLYHVLSGQMPYTGAKSAGEILKRVLKGPPKPLVELEPDVPVDLLAIVDKAMHRDEAQRYPNARELAEDLRRFETGQLVSVHDYSPGLLLRRWIGKHRTAVGVAATMTVLLLFLGAWSFNSISGERDIAEANRAQAVGTRTQAEELINFMLGDLRNKLNPIGQIELLQLVADKVSQYYAESPVDWSRPDEILSRSSAHTNVGEVLVALGNLDGALREHSLALTKLERLGDDVQDGSQGQAALSRAHHEVGIVHLALGDSVNAAREFETALAIDRRLVQREPREPRWQSNLAVIQMHFGDLLASQGKHEQALGRFREAMEIREHLTSSRPEEPEFQRALAGSYSRLGRTLFERGDTVGALPYFEKFALIAEVLSTGHPDDASLRILYSVSVSKIGDVQSRQGQLDSALESYRRVLAMIDELADADPRNTEYKRRQSSVHAKIAKTLDVNGDKKGAMVEYLVSLRLSKDLANRDPNNVDWQLALAANHSKVGTILLVQGALAEAIEHIQISVLIIDELLTKSPDNTGWLHDLMASYSIVGDVRMAQGQLDAATNAYRNALSQAERLASIDPTHLGWQDNLAAVQQRLATSLGASANVEESKDYWRAATATFERLVSADPANPSHGQNLAVAHAGLGRLMLTLGEETQARGSFEKCATSFGEMATTHNDFYNTACCYALMGDSDGAFKWLQKAVDAGWSDGATIAGDSDLVSLQEDARWKELLRTLQTDAPAVDK